MGYGDHANIICNRSRVSISEAFIQETWWSIAENTVMCNIACLGCGAQYQDIDSRDHYYLCRCGRVLKITIKERTYETACSVK